MNVKREKWITEMLNKFYADKKSPTVTFNQELNATQVSYFISEFHVERGLYFWENFFDDESYSEYHKRAVAIAYARLNEIEVPPYVLKDKFNINDINTGQLFDLVRNQGRYCKVKKVTNGYSCTNIKTGKHLIVHEDEEIIPFYP